MAYINVAEWTPDQVTDWLKGLDDSMYNYVYSFTNNEVGGRQLLNIRPYELEQLGMHAIGHQEIVLEAVENLRNFHYNLDKENLQFMALHVATAARSLHRQLAVHRDDSKIETQILNDITRTIATIKPLIGWLDRAPFHGQPQFTEICCNMLRRGLEMATIAQRDRFAEKPVELIRDTALRLEKLANYIIQDITDPMLLQPASLNLVTLKKRESELGFSIEPNYHGVHRVTDIKYNSPAHNSGKIEDGDEIVQINYQTVVGWQYKTVLLQLRESLPDVLLTLKKRPKHTKIYGQIYMQPYRLPSKKRAMGTRWGENLPSPRAGFLTVPEAISAFNLPLSLKPEEKAAATSQSDTESSDSDILTPTDNKSVEKEIRLYYPKPRAMLQRRNTICGDEYLALKSGAASLGIPMWRERDSAGISGDPASPSLRDKSVSFGFGLDANTPRPTTCIGIATSGVGASKLASDVKGLFRETPKQQQSKFHEASTTLATVPEERFKPGVSKVVRFDAQMTVENYKLDEKYTCNVENTILETFEPIPFADEEDEDALVAQRQAPTETTEADSKLVDAINVPLVARRGRLDKSHSTPAYDNSGEESSDTPPPAIEPRKEYLLQMPPVPPPRPRKQKDLLPTVVPPPPPKPLALKPQPQPRLVDIPLTVNETFMSPKEPTPANQVAQPPQQYAAADIPVPVAEVNELHTPSKTRTLTLKKKHSLIAKRRNVNLKLLGTGEIQGHLYRRTKDRRGVTFWARVYFVMLDTILYGFRYKEASKASCVIFLPGFTVSLAKEVHSKPYAFKVYHSAKTFYFAAESQDALTQWVDFIRQAALQTTTLVVELNTRDLFSETESSGEESESVILKNLSTPSPQAVKELLPGSLMQTQSFSAQSAAGAKTTSTPLSSTKHDRRYLGSLRKLTKGTLPFKSSSSSSEKKASSDIPVPTEQYRSYRKVPGGTFGIQIGTNTPGSYHDPAFQCPPALQTSTLVAEQPVVVPLLPRKLSVSSSTSLVASTVEADIVAPITTTNAATITTTTTAITTTTTAIATTTTTAATEAIPASANNSNSNNKNTVTMTIITTTAITTPTATNSRDSPNDSPSIKNIKKIPYNFIHASNPNLVEFDFQTSKTLDYSLPKINSANSWDAHQPIQGFVTLKDLMLQKQQEEAQEMYNNRVLLGVEKKDERMHRLAVLEHVRFNQHYQYQHFLQQYQAQEASFSGKLSKTQSRSLPKTPDYEISFKPDDEAIKRTRTKEGLKLRDFGYELISGDEPINIAACSAARLATIRQNSNISFSNNYEQQQQHAAAKTARQFIKSQLAGHRSKKHSTASISSTTSSVTSASSTSTDFSEKRGDSFKKKGKLEAFKTSSERLFQFSKYGNHHSNQGMTMTLPLNKKSNATYESNATASGSFVGGATGSGIRKSHTYNHDLKEKAGDKYDSHRKNSAPIFSKLTFSGNSTQNNNNNSSSNNGKMTKEKKLLGSPLLHRTIFGHSNRSADQQTPPAPAPAIPYAGRDYDSEIFSQVILPNVPNHYNEHNGAMKYRLLSSPSVITATDVSVAPPPVPSAKAVAVATSPPPPLPSHEPKSGSSSATPEYPNMECPPVFEPEIYSLTDSNASLALLLRRNNSADAAPSGDEQSATRQNTREQ